ncbi:hypothetical protein ACFLZR_00245 [Candidatus Neomarinimicrobiota bacterium]
MTVFLTAVIVNGQELHMRRDALVFRPVYHAPLDTLTISQYWTDVAVQSEKMYNGNGSWGSGYQDWPVPHPDSDHPLVRVVARHAMALSILVQHGLSDTIAMLRIQHSLDWLLQQQSPEGAWPHYTTTHPEQAPLSAMSTALASRALTMGYQVLQYPRYREALSRAEVWRASRSQESDSAYESGLWIGSCLEQYRDLNEPNLLEASIAAAQIVLDQQLTNGSWDTPRPLNTAEHAEVVEGLILLEEELREGHPFRRQLQGGVTAALNYLLEVQSPNGNYTDNNQNQIRLRSPSLEIVALVRARAVRSMAEFDQPIVGALRAMNLTYMNDTDSSRGSQDVRFLAMTTALVWFVEESQNETIWSLSPLEFLRGNTTLVPDTR